MKALRSIGVIAMVLTNVFAAGPAHAVTATIGDALVDRALDDGASGSIFVLPDLTFNGSLTQWAFFDNDNATPNRQVTPLVVEQISNTQYRVVGIGTTVTTGETGVQGPFAFGLLSGSNATGPGRLFAYKDGSNGTDNVGVIDYNDNANDFIRWLGPNNTVMAIGDIENVNLNLGRTYSVQFTESTTGTIVGDAPIVRAFNDGATGSMFVMPDALPAGQLAQWGFFDHTDPNQSVTPLIFELVGGNYVLRGTGTTRTSNGTGGQSFDFGLVSGTDSVGPNFYFGWKDGSNGGDNDGVIDFDNVGGDLIRWLGPNQTSFAIGQSRSVVGDFGRSYSVQVHINAAVSAVPEPATAMLGVMSVAGLLFRRRARTA